MPSRRLRGEAPEITLDQAQQRQKRAHRQAKRARVAAAAFAKASEAASDAAAAMLGLGSEKSVEKNDQKEENSSPKIFGQVSSAGSTGIVRLSTRAIRPEQPIGQSGSHRT